MTSAQTAVNSSVAGRRSRLGRRPLLAFFILACAWTWVLIGVAVLGSASGVLPEDSPIVAILANIVPFGPALAAVVLAAATSGRAGLRNLLGSLNPRRIGFGWYLLALFGPPIAIQLTATLRYGTDPLLALIEQWPIVFTKYLPYTLTVALVGTGLAEELGWRGFAQPRPNLVAGPGGALGLLLQILYTTVVALLFTWAYNRNRGSVLIVALLHAALNTSSWLLGSLVPIGNIEQFRITVYLIALVAVSIAGVLLVLLTWGRLGAPIAE